MSDRPDRVPKARPSAVSAAPRGGSRSALLLVLAIASVCLLELTLVVHSGLLAAAPTTDETFTLLTVRTAPWSLVRGIRSDPGMASYYTTLTAWSWLQGDEIRDLRLFSLACFGVAVICICAVAWSSQRLTWGWLAAAAFALSPATREAVLDARAAMFATAMALVTLCLLRPLRTDTPILLLGSAAVAATVLAYSHPSALFLAIAAAGLLVWSTRTATRRAQAIAVAAVLAQIPALAVNFLQASSAQGVARPGLSGVEHVLSSSLGGHAVIAGMTLLVCLVVALLGQGRDVSARVMATAGVSWFLAALVALPIVSLMLPRYFVASAGAVAAGLALLPRGGWFGRAGAAVLALAVVGGASQAPQPPREPSQWCELTSAVDRAYRAGDTVVFTNPMWRTPIVACLGERAAEFFGRGEVVPRTPIEDLDDPRSLWRVAEVEVPEAAIRRGARRLVMWDNTMGEEDHRYLVRLRRLGESCVDHSLTSGLGFSVCEVVGE